MPDISKRLEKADKYLQKGKPDSALEEYLGILEQDPRNQAVRLKAADLCVSMNRTGDAFQLISEVFNQEAAAGDGTHAVLTYKRLARLGQPSVEQTFLFAQFVEKSARKEAIEAYELVIRDFVASGRRAEELMALRRVIALDPTFVRLSREGELAEALGDTAAASDAFVRAGEFQHQNGQPSLGTFERALRLDPHNPAAALACGEGYLAEQRFADAIRVTEPFALPAQSGLEFRDAYARALMGAGRALEAEPYVRELFAKDPTRTADMCMLIGALLDADDGPKAVALTQELAEQENKRNRRREFVTTLKEIGDAHPPRVEFLEYLVEAFNSNNREQDYCAALSQLFDLYYAIGQFIKAGDALDRAAEVDPYEEGHQKRVEMLRGKIDANRFNTIAGRIGSAVQTGAPDKAEEAPAGGDSETTVLEDLMLQAEIFLQYSMRSRAVERLERVGKLFPREEDKNVKLRQLYTNAGFLPKYEGGAAPPPAAAGKEGTAAAASAGVPQAMADENAVDNFSRVTEITRNIYRQANVKGVLFAAVNDVGRHWNASRCVAGLCALGKPPSAALEYCAPGVKQSDVMAIVKLIATLQALAVEHGSVTIESARAAPELQPITSVLETLDIASVLAVPLMDGDEAAGILILEQCGTKRQWRQTDVVVLRTIADQMTLAANNARLRSLMKTLAVTDEKSGLLKRASYIDVLLSEVRRSLQQTAPMTLMLMQAGTGAAFRDLSDQVVESLMQQVGQTVCGNVRQNDVAVRYDRQTIAVCLADTNDKNAFFVIDKLRKLLAATRMPGQDQPVPLTVGIAEAVLNAQYDPIDIVTELINRGEVALDSARAAGANQVRSVAASVEGAAVA